MRGVKKNRAHAVEYGFLYHLGDFVGNLIVSAVTPPDDNVRIVEYFLGNTAVFVVKRCGSYLDIVLF